MNRVAVFVLVGAVLLLDVTLPWPQSWNPTASAQNMCPSTGQPNVPCDFGVNCFGGCCLSSGLCPSFSCTANFANFDIRNDANTTCSGNCLEEIECRPFLPDCSSIQHNEVCIGTVVCTTANCGGKHAGDICLTAGTVIKVCSGLGE